MHPAGLHPASYWQREPDGRVRCTLCPRRCRLAEGQAGFCFVRRNVAGALVSLAYGRSTGFAVDPVEQKPLNHFLPGASVLSFGTAGCNLGCACCRHWSPSHARAAEGRSGSYEPGEVVDLAVASGCPAIAFTYNDPVVWAEWAVDVARAARERGVKTVFVTAGYLPQGPREEILSHMDAANVDLKALSEDFYARVTLGHLAPVLETLEWLARSGVWTEVTNLVVPGLNDAPAEIRRLAWWVGEHMGSDVPLHFAAFHPDFRMRDRPSTCAATLSRARALAREVGLHHVYTSHGGDPEGQATRCPACGELLIARRRLALLASRLEGDACPRCGTRLAGRFAPPAAPDPTAWARGVHGLA